jgi:ribonuclease HI
MYTFITDGAYSFSRDQGGAAVIILKDGKKITQISRAFKHTTNNKMEVIAVILALMCIKKPLNKIEIITDSMYVIGTATLSWKRKKNIKLWKKFDEIYQQKLKLCPNIIFKHVKGHSGDKWNELADELAVNASQLMIDEK